MSVGIPSTLLSVIKFLFKWGMFLVFIIIALKLITYFLPMFGQNNIKNALINKNATSTKGFLFNLPPPGSWKGGSLTGAKIIEPLPGPSVSDFNQGGSNYVNVPNTPEVPTINFEINNNVNNNWGQGVNNSDWQTDSSFWNTKSEW